MVTANSMNKTLSVGASLAFVLIMVTGSDACALCVVIRWRNWRVMM